MKVPAIMVHIPLHYQGLCARIPVASIPSADLSGVPYHTEQENILPGPGNNGCLYVEFRSGAKELPASTILMLLKDTIVEEVESWSG